MASTVLRPDPVIKALHGAFCRNVSRQELLQVAATRIQEVGAPYAGVYLYAIRGHDLELEASAGHPTEITSVPVGEVVKSDLVVMIRLHDEVLGEIAIESDVPDAFGEAEESAVREIADALAVLL